MVMIRAEKSDERGWAEAVGKLWDYCEEHKIRSAYSIGYRQETANILEEEYERYSVCYQLLDQKPRSGVYTVRPQGKYLTVCHKRTLKDLGKRIVSSYSMHQHRKSYWESIAMKIRCLTGWSYRRSGMPLPDWSARLHDQGIRFRAKQVKWDDGTGTDIPLANKILASAYKAHFLLYTDAGDCSFVITDIPGSRGYPGQPHRLRHPDISVRHVFGAHFSSSLNASNSASDRPMTELPSRIPIVNTPAFFPSECLRRYLRL